MIRNLYLLLLIPFTLNAKVVYVDVNSTADIKDGVAWTTAYSDISVALQSAFNGDDLYVSAGIYEVSESLIAKEGVDIYGGFNAMEAPDMDTRNYTVHEAIIKATNNNRVLYVANKNFATNTYFDGLSLTNGGSGNNSAGLNGAGAYLRQGSHLINCRIYGNSSKNGAVNLDAVATCPDDMIPTIIDCIIEENQNYQGAVYCNGLGNIKSSIIRNNTTEGTCGGVFLNAGNVIESSLLEDNICYGKGGALFFRLGGEAIDCVIKNNYATDNGGGVCFNSGGIIKGCIVRGNESLANGGAIDTYTSLFNYAVDIVNCKIYNNKSKEQGGGIYTDGATNIFNCIISNNESGSSGSGIYAMGATVTNSTITKNKNNYNGLADQIGCAGVFLSSIRSASLYNSVVWGNEVADNLGDSSFTQICNDDYTSAIKHCAIQGLDANDVANQVHKSSCINLSADNNSIEGPQFLTPSESAGSNIEPIQEYESTKFFSIDDIVVHNTFTAGEGGVSTYRIPSIISAVDSSLLVFCEARLSSWRDKSPTDIVVRRSTDEGETWSETVVITEQVDSEAYMDPVPVVDKETGSIFLFFNRWPGAGKEVDLNVPFMSRSDDNGVTWSVPVDIKSTIVEDGHAVTGFGPGSGFQIKNGEHAGRLYLPCRQHNLESNSGFIRTLYSDDHGETWQLGIPTAFGGEQQFTEMSDGRLMSNIRMSGARRIAYSKDGGVSWGTPYTDPTLVVPIGGCHAGVISQDSVVIFSSPYGGEVVASNRDNRYDLTLWRSLNNGKTWGQKKLIYSQASGYSCMTLLSDNRIALVFETAVTKGFTKVADRGDGWLNLDVLLIPATVWDQDYWIE